MNKEIRMVGNLEIPPNYTIDELQEICWNYGQLYENLSSTQIAICVFNYEKEELNK